MKVLITGPRSELTKDLKLPHMHLEYDLEDLPKKGETIILNGGMGYTVKDIMWWVKGPENDDYWATDRDYSVTAEHEIVHVVVEPRDHKGIDLYAEGMAAGKKQAAADLERIVAMVSKAGDATVAAAVRGWLEEAKEGTK